MVLATVAIAFTTLQLTVLAMMFGLLALAAARVANHRVSQLADRLDEEKLEPQRLAIRDLPDAPDEG